jgi:hypothetical protein
VEYRHVKNGIDAHRREPQNTSSIERIRDLRGWGWFEPSDLETEGVVILEDKPLRTKGQLRAAALKYIEASVNRPRAR